MLFLLMFCFCVFLSLLVRGRCPETVVSIYTPSSPSSVMNVYVPPLAFNDYLYHYG